MANVKYYPIKQSAEKVYIQKQVYLYASDVVFLE